MPDLAVVFDPSGSLDAPSVAGRLEGVLEAGNARFKTARVLDPCIAAVNVLKRFSFAPDQPLRDEDGNGDAWMMVDGALFHKGGADKALNDLRVGLRSQGEKALFALNGQFNGIKYIPSEKRLVIVTDRLGSRPLYHSCEGGKHVIASEMKAVVAAAGRPVALDHLGVLELFAFGHNLGSRTVLERINVLPPGSVVTIDEKGLRTSSYFKYRYQPLTENASSAFCGEGLAEAVRESMPLYLEGSARKCIFLSGGLDSRIIAASIDTDRYHVDAVTFGYPEARDVRYAARLSELLGFEHQIMTYPRVYLSKVIRRVVERTECATAFHHSTSVLFHDEIAKRAESILVGFCGDVFSGGHLRPGMFSTRPGSGLAGMLFDRALCGSVKEVSRIFRDDVFKSLWSGLDAAFRESVNSIQDQAGHDVADVWDVVNRQRRFTFSAPKVDRRRFEVVAPLLDNRFVEQVLSLPASARKGQAAYRHAIVTGFPLISGVPQAARSG